MNEDKEEKQRSATNEKGLWPFILATLVTLPLLIIIVAYTFNVPLIGRLHLPGINVLSIGPIMTVLAGIAGVFIFLSWVMSPFWCRFILSFYILVIVIILILIIPSSVYVT